MQIGHAFTFMFTDASWPSKLGVALLLNLPASLVSVLGYQLLRPFIPTALQGVVGSPLWWPVVVGLAAVPFPGYVLRLLRQVIAGADTPLPAWSDGGSLIRDGLRYWGVASLWMLVPAIVNSMADSGGSLVRTGDDPLIVGGMLLVGIVSLIGLALSLVDLVAEPAAQARLAETGFVAAGLDVRQVLRTVGHNLSGYGLLVVVSLAGSAVMLGLGFVVARWLVMTGHLPSSLATMPLLEAGAVFVLPLLDWYLRLALAHLAGQAYLGAVPGAHRHAQHAGQRQPSG